MQYWNSQVSSPKAFSLMENSRMTVKTRQREKWLWYIAKIIAILCSLFLEPISPTLESELALYLALANSHVVKLLLYQS